MIRRLAVSIAFLVVLLPGAAVTTDAQQPCSGDLEPNDAPAMAETLTTTACVAGMLPGGDQDLALWEVPAADATTRWTISLEGIPGVLTGLKFFQVTSDPGVEPVVVAPSHFLEVAAQPDDLEQIVLQDALLPVGRYLLGISHSALEPTSGEPDTSYTYRIERGEPLPPDSDVEPNDDAVTAVRVAGAFDISGDLDGSADFYAWDVTDAEGRWNLELEVPLGLPAALRLSDPGGTVIDEMRTLTQVRSLDLALTPGTYTIEVSPRAYAEQPYVLHSEPTGLDWDPEPNDTTATAIAVEAETQTYGRLAGDGDRDRFVLTVAGGDPLLHDLRVIWRSSLERSLCLLDAVDDEVVCRKGQGGVALTDLSLPPGRHTFEISGPEDGDDPYLLRVDTTSAAARDFEAEPNEDPSNATLIDPALGMRARGRKGDTDTFRLHAEGEPQLWQIEMSGTGIEQLSWIRPNGLVLDSGTIDANRTEARLTDLYLVPGDHWFRAKAEGPAYSLTTTPLGAPDPDAEREPNNGPSSAGRYHIGSSRSGRLPATNDRDFFRFTLAAPQRIGLDLQQPSDGIADLWLHTGEQILAAYAGSGPGALDALDLWLPAGDYLIELKPAQASQSKYQLTSRRLDPFTLAVDQEPNDSAGWAQDVPASLRWTGGAVTVSDEDWFRIPMLASSESLIISIDDPVARVRLVDGREQISLDNLGNGRHVANDVPMSESVYLAIASNGPYRVELRGAGLEPHADPFALPLTLEWEFDDATVAAYWPQGQRLDGSLRIANTGATDLEATIKGATSHYLWQVRLGQEVVTIPAGASVAVPASILVGSDAWAAEPVLITAKASTSDGGITTASVTLTADADVAPVAPATDWSVPAELLGGSNVAAGAFGAQPGGTVAADREAGPFDGGAPDGSLAFQVNELPLELSVSLAGEGPVPVTGVILNPRGGTGRLSDRPRDFELLLSNDGVTWTTVMRGVLSPLAIDQAFVLDRPIEATHAMLRIGSVYGDASIYVSLGEWKVIAAPGTVVSGVPSNIADPTVGGHLVKVEPFNADRGLGTGILDGSLERDAILLNGSQRFDLVIGFQHGRAAQVRRLEWQDPDGTLEAERLASVEVLASLLGPNGPWQRLGDWDLARARDGTTGAFEVPAPGWVRYLRITGRAPADARAIEVPGVLRVIERTTDATYRSILGEWGENSSRGPLEWTAQDTISIAATGSDAGDDATAATLLSEGMTVADRVEIDVDEDWFAVKIPPGRNTLELVVGGLPTVGVALTLVDASGAQRPMAFSTQPDGTVRYQAQVEPGAIFHVRVHQPPFSAVFAFDTSGSIGPFLDLVLEGMRAFAADVQPGREAVVIVPFEERPLLSTWEDDPYLLQDAVNNHVAASGSSGAEAGLIDATGQLEEREGARAVLLVTDAETSTYHLSPELWERLSKVRPIIFSVQVGALTQPVGSRQLMQDWAASGGGVYVYPSTHGEMDRAFERMATWLRRPASYSIEYVTRFVGPSSLAVHSSAGAAASTLAPGVGVEIILDTSGSMLERLDGRRRIDIAKEALESLIGDSLGDGVPIAVRTFGGKGKKASARCQSRLTLPLAPLDRRAMSELIRGLAAVKKTKTPIAAALAAIAQDMEGITGPRSVVLVTDGDETCGGDPGAAIADLRAAGVDVNLNIVGFALDDAELAGRMAMWADAGGGTYFDAAGAAELAESLATALSAPFRVYDADGRAIEGGTVGGDAIFIEPGVYRVEVLVDPPLEFTDVVIEAGASVELELPGED